MNILKFAIFMCCIFTVLSEDFPKDEMNTANIRFVSTNGTYSLYYRNSDCYNCLFSKIMNVYQDQTTSWRTFDMQHALDFYVEQDEYVSEFTRLNFQEYGCYTIEISSLVEPFSVFEDKQGHDYNDAAYIIFGSTAILLILYIIIENIIKYIRRRKDVLLPEETTVQDLNSNKRVLSIDVFRGIWLLFMIFSNFGGGMYYWWRHAAYNGTTMADLCFPSFMFCMGMSLRISVNSHCKKLYNQGASSFKVFMTMSGRILRRVIVFTLFCWLQNGVRSFEDARFFGVMVYFAISTFFNSYLFVICNIIIHHFPKCDKYRLWMELIPSLIILFINWGLSDFYPLPDGCPRGYRGPGGIGDNGMYQECTGGANRVLDNLILGENHVYTGTSCKPLYHCLSTDSEGVLGSLNAVFITYLGSLITYITNSCKKIKEKKYYHLSVISIYLILGLCLMLLAGFLSEFKRDGGYIPINKTLWSTSFIFYVGGLDFIFFIFVYLIVDVCQAWSGYPFTACGRNSLLIYMIHEMCIGIIPFGYSFEVNDHLHQLISFWIIGCGSWIIIANYLDRQKIYIKI